jgi:nucleolar protein 56
VTLRWAKSKLPLQNFLNNLCRIFGAAGFTAAFNDSIEELFRGIRTHFQKLLKKATEEDLRRAQLGLAHSYSR